MSEKEWIMKIGRQEIHNLVQLIVSTTVVEAPTIPPPLVDAAYKYVKENYVNEKGEVHLNFLIYASGILRSFIKPYLEYHPTILTADEYFELFPKKK
jgi:hypothetical protein